MRIKKSSGTTPTERLLADLCERTFLKLWSYPNPYKDDGKEFCDLLAVFENHVFIFFDPENRQLQDMEKDPDIAWRRWKTRVIDDQVRTARGAEAYLRRGRRVFLDSKLAVPFPLSIAENVIIHKIIVAHGAKEACEGFSKSNVSGSLAISYSDGGHEGDLPFMVGLEKTDPVHVLDSNTLPIILEELDTFFDLTSYFDQKVQAIQAFDHLSYCGEEDLLAHYFCNFDEAAKRHFIGVPGTSFNGLMIGEGEWQRFIERDEYKRKTEENRGSYLWDKLIQHTCQNALDGTLMGDARLLEGKSAIHEMAKEPRFMRRALAGNMDRVIRRFPDSTSGMTRHVSFMPSFHQGKGYVFLQVKLDGAAKDVNYREVRKHMLEVACGATKIKVPELNTVIGIGMDAPKFAKENSEDFVLMDCSDWTPERHAYYEQENKDLGFFASTSIVRTEFQVSEFPPLTPNPHAVVPRHKVGRNALCPCGSGLKYKRCCMNP